MKAPFPLGEFSGTAYDCARQFALWSVAHFPDYQDYGRMLVEESRNAPKEYLDICRREAPFLLEFFRAFNEVFGSSKGNSEARQEGCSSFACRKAKTRFAGQNKDTLADRLPYMLMLHLCLTDGPQILTLAYPGELLGYGMWSNGASIFRNALYAEGLQTGLHFHLFGLLAMALNDVGKIAELAKRFPIRGAGNLLISCCDADVDVEFSAGGTAVLSPNDGLLAHTNHPLVATTIPFALPAKERQRQGSVQRLEQLQEGLRNLTENPDAEAFRKMLSHHNPNGESLCRHTDDEKTVPITTASLLADSAAGILYATKRQPCLQPFFPYSLS